MSRLLVVEDDEDVAKLLERLFTRAGHEVIQAADGRTALRRAYERRPDLVLIDMNLPDMTGLELVQRVRADAALAASLAGARWVALSADNPGDVVRAARAAGFDDYWLKPIDVPQFPANLRKLLARGRAAP